MCLNVLSNMFPQMLPSMLKKLSTVLGDARILQMCLNMLSDAFEYDQRCSQICFHVCLNMHPTMLSNLLPKLVLNDLYKYAPTCWNMITHDQQLWSLLEYACTPAFEYAYTCLQICINIVKFVQPCFGCAFASALKSVLKQALKYVFQCAFKCALTPRVWVPLAQGSYVFAIVI